MNAHARDIGHLPLQKESQRVQSELGKQRTVHAAS